MSDKINVCPSFGWDFQDDGRVSIRKTLDELNNGATYSGKFWNVRTKICKNLPKHNVYVEFCNGGDGVYLFKEPSNEEYVVEQDTQTRLLCRIIKSLTDDEISLLKERDWESNEDTFDSTLHMELINKLDYLYKYSYLRAFGVDGVYVEKTHGEKFDLSDRLPSLRDRFQSISFVDPDSDLSKIPNGNSLVVCDTTISQEVVSKYTSKVVIDYTNELSDDITGFDYMVSANYPMYVKDNGVDVERADITKCVQEDKKSYRFLVYKQDDSNIGVFHHAHGYLALKSDEEFMAGISVFSNVTTKYLSKSSVDFDLFENNSEFIDTFSQGSLDQYRINLIQLTHNENNAEIITKGSVVWGAQTTDNLEMFLEFDDDVYDCGRYLVREGTKFGMPSNQTPTIISQPDIEFIVKNEGVVNILEYIDYPYLTDDKLNSSEVKFITKSEDTHEHFVYGIVLEPETVDAHNDVISKEDIRKAAHTFMEKFGGAVGTQHKYVPKGLTVLETYVAPTKMNIAGVVIKEGTWLMGVRVNNSEVWKRILLGLEDPDHPDAFTGFSVQGLATVQQL